MRREDSIWWRNGFTREWWDALDAVGRFNFLETLTDAEVESFHTDWRVWGRDNQLAPEGDENWDEWLLLAGRGFGKSRTGSEQVRGWVEDDGIGRLCLLGQGEDDVREVMIEGESGILACSPNAWRPKFYPSVGCGRLEWPNGALAFVYSAADPEALRGPQFEKSWVDEPMAFPPEARTKAISNLEFGLRLGARPQIIYTTTPKPHRWLRAKIEKAKKDKGIRITRGSTYENAANLAERYIKKINNDYDGTTLGRQEIYAEILGDEEGALFTSDTLDKFRIRGTPPEEIAKTCDRVIIGVDPNVSANGNSHAAGIVPCGSRGDQRFCLGDWSTKGGPHKWSQKVVDAFEHFHADEVVAEVNNGGDLVMMVIQQVAKDRGIDIPVRMVRASRGKTKRAEPVAAAAEQGRISMVGEVGYDEKPGPLFILEQQLMALHDGFDPSGEDYDRADAFVWGMTRLARKGDKGASSSGGNAGILTFDKFRPGAEAA